MKYIIIIISIMLFSFTLIQQPGYSNSIVLIPADTVDNRPTFHVIFHDSSYIEHMYPEEIAQSLITGEWDYNEDLRVR
jgi:hypothetical protein